VWDPDGLWTQKAAEELLRNTREYYSAVMMLHKNAEIGQGIIRGGKTTFTRIC
jgi:hypothetical protein